MTLALLLTAVGGAWAQTPTIYFQQDYATETVDWSTATAGRFTPIVENGYLTVTQSQRNNNGTTLTCTATQGKVDAGKDFTMTFNVKLGASTNQTATAFNIYDAANSAPILSFAEGEIYAKAWKINGGTQTATVSAGGGKSLDELSWIFVQVTYIAGENAKTYLTLKDEQNNIIDGFDKTEIPTLSVAGGLGKMTFVTSRYLANFAIDNVLVCDVVNDEPASEPAIEVTTNAAEEGATFTEASFEMPAFDATADYELVRDMGYKVAFSGVPTRARLAKDGNGKFHFADGLTFQLLDNIDAANPKDITSAEGITFMVGEVEAVDFEGNTFYQLNKETLVPLADFLADAHLGNYAICAVASTGEYDGSFSSGMITLFQGYEVEVAAKEFITYYKDEPLRVEDEAAELYTISSVNGDQAVLSQKSDAMPSNTPMLVYNKSNETKVILLIPCAEPDLAITVAPEFQGTLTGTTIAASTESQTNYAFNGKAFVFVKDAIEVGPNKAWLSINTGEPSARIMLVFDDVTEVKEVKEVNGIKEVNWYDLNGRKLQAAPTKKGVYIMNGKKVVVK
jgi:hypothetical protein